MACSWSRAQFGLNPCSRPSGALMASVSSPALSAGMEALSALPAYAAAALPARSPWMLVKLDVKPTRDRRGVHAVAGHVQAVDARCAFEVVQAAEHARAEVRAHAHGCSVDVALRLGAHHLALARVVRVSAGRAAAARDVGGGLVLDVRAVVVGDTGGGLRQTIQHHGLRLAGRVACGVLGGHVAAAQPDVLQPVPRVVDERVARCERRGHMEVVVLLAGDGQPQVVADELAVERVVAHGVARRLVAAAAHAHDHRFRIERDHGAAGHVEAHGAHHAIAVLHHVGDHGVVGHGDVVVFKRLHELLVAVVLDVRFAIPHVIEVLEIVGRVHGARVLVEDAPAAQALVRIFRVVDPRLVPVGVADVLGAGQHAALERLGVVAHVGVEPAMRAGPRRQSRITRTPLVHQHDVRAFALGCHSCVQSCESAADD